MRTEEGRGRCRRATRSVLVMTHRCGPRDTRLRQSKPVSINPIVGDRSRLVQVMLVERDARVRSLVADALTEDNLEIAGVAGAEDALILLGAGPVPDMLVAEGDLGTGPSGTDLALVAREGRPDVEIVLIGGLPPLQPPEQGCNRPIAPCVLAEKIREAAARLSDRGG